MVLSEGVGSQLYTLRRTRSVGCTVFTSPRAYTRYRDNPLMPCEAGLSSLPYWTCEETEVLRGQCLGQGQARHACYVEARTQAAPPAP